MANDRLAERLADLRSAAERLREAVVLWRANRSMIVRDSMIKRFEFTFELAWKTARDWMRVWERDIRPNGPRQVLESAFSRNVIADANRWSEMLENRNRTVHVYDEDEIDDIAVWISANVLELIDALIERVSRNG